MPIAIIAQDVFEPADFNVTEALLENGVNVSAIPEFSGLGGRARSVVSGCEVTVSYHIPTTIIVPGRLQKCYKVNGPNLILPTVHLTPSHLWR
jgi:hypothetical protein